MHPIRHEPRDLYFAIVYKNDCLVGILMHSTAIDHEPRNIYFRMMYTNFTI